jgi:hypothetical protein
MASAVPSLSCWPVVFSNPALAVWTSTLSPPPLPSPSLSPLPSYPPYLHHGRSIESGFDVVLSLFRPRLSFKHSCSSVSHSRPSLRIGHSKRTRIICTFNIRSLLPLLASPLTRNHLTHDVETQSPTTLCPSNSSPYIESSTFRPLWPASSCIIRQ